MVKKLFKIRWKMIMILAVITIIWIITLACGNKAIQKSDKAAYILDVKSISVKSGALDNPEALSTVGFVSMRTEPDDEEVKKMIDDAIYQVLGSEGLSSIIKKGDKVVIKVNNVGPYIGKTGEKGRGIITDPRITRYMAEKVRDIVGFEETADVKVVDALFYAEKNPSSKFNKTSFYSARLERSNDNNIYYDKDCDGYLDGTSKAQLVNLDSYGLNERFLVQVKDDQQNYINVWMPDFMRTKEIAKRSGLFTNEYCDELIGLPIFKSHGIAGITGALKLHYGFRPFQSSEGDTGRWGHSGLYWDIAGMHKKQNLLNYLCAQHKVREYDFILMDCLTGNRRGPLNPDGGISTVNESQAVDYILVHALS